MIISYCKACLPTKFINGYGSTRKEADQPHLIHDPVPQNGLIGIGMSVWKTIFVDGDDAQTRANIISTLGDRFI